MKGQFWTYLVKRLGLGLFTLPLGHQPADLLAQTVTVGAQLVGSFIGGQLFLIQGDGFVHQGELGILEFFTDVFLYGFRIFTDKFNV